MGPPCRPSPPRRTRKSKKTKVIDWNSISLFIYIFLFILPSAELLDCSPFPYGASIPVEFSDAAWEKKKSGSVLGAESILAQRAVESFLISP